MRQLSFRDQIMQKFARYSLQQWAKSTLNSKQIKAGTWLNDLNYFRIKQKYMITCKIKRLPLNLGFWLLTGTNGMLLDKTLLLASNPPLSWDICVTAQHNITNIYVEKGTVQHKAHKNTTNKKRLSDTKYQHLLRELADTER